MNDENIEITILKYVVMIFYIFFGFIFSLFLLFYLLAFFVIIMSCYCVLILRMESYRIFHRKPMIEG